MGKEEESPKRSLKKSCLSSGSVSHECLPHLDFSPFFLSADAIFVAPLYLHNLLDSDRFGSHNVVDPSGFHSPVLQEYQRILGSAAGANPGNAIWRQEVPRLVHLSKAQALLLQRYPQIPLPNDAESVVLEIAAPALRACIAQRDAPPPAMTHILAHSAQVLTSNALQRDP